MPYLSFSSNIQLSEQQRNQLAKAFSSILAQQTGKPERYVMVNLHEQHTMLFGGNDQPLAYLECKSIGLTAQQAKALSAALCELIPQHCAIAPDRIYIEFNNCPAELWGWNGGTFA